MKRREIVAGLAGVALASPFKTHAQPAPKPIRLGWHWAAFADGGNLLSYGPDLRASWKRIAYFVDRVARGTKVADLPIELPTTVEMVINLRTAKALGLTIPQPLLLRADRVIE